MSTQDDMEVAALRACYDVAEEQELRDEDKRRTTVAQALGAAAAYVALLDDQAPEEFGAYVAGVMRLQAETERTGAGKHQLTLVQ